MSSSFFSFRNKYVRSLLGVGYDSNRENTLALVLLISSILLTLASAYTTYVGLHQYVPALFAVFMSCGINGLLYVVSWRIGVMFVAGGLKPSLAIIFLITFCTSVFFSYSALLDNIYDRQSRDRDELRRSKVNAEKLTFQLTERVKQKSNYSTSANDIRLDLDKWYSRTVQAYSGTVADLRDRLTRSQLRYNQLTLRLNELRSRGQSDSQADQIQKKESMRQGIASNELIPLDTRLERIDPKKEAFDKAYKSLIQNDRSMTIANYTEMLSAYKSYVGELIQSARGLKVEEVPPSVQKTLEALDDINAFLVWQANEMNLAKKQTPEDVKLMLFEFLNRLPKGFVNRTDGSDDVSRTLEEIEKIGRYGGADVHPFVLSVGEFSNGNYLATGSLLMALALDGLVLLCGLVGARPSSFLTMRRSDQLDEAIETGLVIVLAMKVKDRPPSGNALIDKITRILNLCEPDVQAAQVHGLPATVSFDQIKAERLTAEMGILIAAGLARVNNEQRKIGLTLRFILWMAEQVQRFDQHKPTAAGFEDFKGAN